MEPPIPFINSKVELPLCLSSFIYFLKLNKG